jgi:hypothetical protein
MYKYVLHQYTLQPKLTITPYYTSMHKFLIDIYEKLLSRMA